MMMTNRKTNAIAVACIAIIATSACLDNNAPKSGRSLSGVDAFYAVASRGESSDAECRSYGGATIAKNEYVKQRELGQGVFLARLTATDETAVIVSYGTSIYLGMAASVRSCAFTQ